MALKKTWRISDFECTDCGDLAEVETAAKDNFYYDGDLLRCPSCGKEGQVIIDDEDEDGGIAWDLWQD